MKILLEPTGSHEVFNGQTFRLFKGKTDSGLEVQMLGMFRVSGGDIAREAFVRQIAQHVHTDERHPTLVLDPNKLVSP